MSKERLTTIRLTEAQRAFVENESERQGASAAEVVRRIIDDYRSPEKILVPLEGPEREWVDSLAEAIGDTPGKAVRMVLIHYRQVMEAPLATILKPAKEVLEELSRRD
jgi:hypothetical protein